METETRLKQLNDLSHSINRMEKQFNDLMELLKWDRKQLIENVKNDINENNLTSISNETININSNNVVNEEMKLIDTRNVENFEVQKHEPVTGGSADSHIILEPELIVSVKDKNNTKNMTFAEIIKLKRDLKRRRMKHRTSKTPPLSYTEKIRALISLQMETWTQYLESDKPLNID